jgi:6-phosphofructokinase 1
VKHHNNLAILVGGGPAPGINSVIGAATIRARLEEINVIGLRDGFEWIMHGDTDHVIPLTIDAVSRIHFRGGSYIGISRANPTANPQHLQNTLMSLLRMNVTQLITIALSTCRRPSTTTWICRPTSTHLGTRRRVTSASRS